MRLGNRLRRTAGFAAADTTKRPICMPVVLTT